MTRKELEKTAWAKRYKKEDPCTYEDGLIIAKMPDLPVIVYKDIIETDNPAGGLRVAHVWVVSTLDHYWLDAFKLKKEALALCKEMGWKIIK